MARKSKNKTNVAKEMFAQPKDSGQGPVIVASSPVPAVAARSLSDGNLSFAEVFKYKQFARNFVSTNGDVATAFDMTFGPGEERNRMFQIADAILSRDFVRIELERLLPKMEDVMEGLNAGVIAPTPPVIRWGEKLEYLKMALELKGVIKGKGDGQGTPQINVSMVIER